MLYLDIVKACNNKGIDNPRRWLVQNGFSHVAAARLLQNTQESINYATLDKLCILLFCTPNELLSWQPAANAAIAANHPLEKLKHVSADQSISGKLKTLPPEKIEEVQKFLDGLTAAKTT